MDEKKKKLEISDNIFNIPIVILGAILVVLLIINFYDVRDMQDNNLASQNLTSHNSTKMIDNESFNDNHKTNSYNLKNTTKPLNLSMANINDNQLISIISESDQTLIKDLMNIQHAANIQDNQSLDKTASILEIDTKKYLDELNQRNIYSNISIEYRLLHDEYKLELGDFNNVGKNIQSYFINPRSDGLKVALNYMKEGSIHYSNIRYLLNYSVR